MRLRFFVNQATGEPHIQDHGVSEEEVEELVEGSPEVRAGHRGVQVALGQTLSGRYLRVVYRWAADRETLFVITAYEPGPKTIGGWRRRRRKKR